MTSSLGSSGAHAHTLVADTAKEMAHEAYAALMQRNDWYALWKESHPGASPKGLEELWVRQKWGSFVEAARATLAGMLQTSADSALKDTIAEALILDNTLTKGRKAGTRLLGHA